MTELALNWFRGIWGREVLRRKVEQMEARYDRIRGLIETLRETNTRQGIEIMQLEQDNARMTVALKGWEDANKRIDPNAKCPVCGAMNGFLAHVPKFDPVTKLCIDILCQNNCRECGAKFISAEPVAGRREAAALYQHDTDQMPKRIAE